MKELELVEERLNMGRERYGHGVRPSDDTTQWGTKTNSWLEMAREEIIDCMIYVCADYIRENNIEYEGDANSLILQYLETPGSMRSPYHAYNVNMLQYMLSTSILRQVAG